MYNITCPPTPSSEPVSSAAPPILDLPDPSAREIARLRRELDSVTRDLADTRQEGRRLHAFLSYCSDAIGVMDAQGILQYASPATSRMLGYDTTEFVGENPFALIHEHDVADVIAAFAQLLKQPYGSVTSRYRVRHREGRWLWVEAVGTNLLSEPTVQGIVINYRDIEERVRQDEDMHHILAGAHCLLWHAEVNYLGDGEPLDWRLRFPNEESAYRFLSLAPAADQPFVTAWHVSRPEPDRSRADTFARQEILAGRNYQQQFRYRRADGTMAWISEDVCVETVQEGRWRLVGVCTDITALKRREREIEALNDRLQAAMLETHHRVKNNLQLLSATIELSETEDTVVPVTTLNRLKLQIRTLGAMHDILTEAVRGEHRGGIVPAKSMLDRLLSMLETTMSVRPFHREIEDAPLSGRQSTALALIVQEIVANALKHGNGAVSVRFKLEAGSAVLEVEDDGPGFPAGFDPAEASSTGLELIGVLARHDLDAVPIFTIGAAGGLVRLVIPFRAVVEFSPALGVSV